MAYLNLTNQLTKEGRKNIKVGDVLMFSEAHIKVMRKNKDGVWGKRMRLYHPDEVDEDIMNEVRNYQNS